MKCTAITLLTFSGTRSSTYGLSGQFSSIVMSSVRFEIHSLRSVVIISTLGFCAVLHKFVRTEDYHGKWVLNGAFQV